MVPPVWVVLPASVVSPVPACTSEPVPDTTLLSVKASDRLIANDALFVTLPVPSEPVAPPSPICSVPALIVVPPMYVLLDPERICVPAPFFLNNNAPVVTCSESCPAKLAVEFEATLTIKVALVEKLMLCSRALVPPFNPPFTDATTPLRFSEGVLLLPKSTPAAFTIALALSSCKDPFWIVTKPVKELEPARVATTAPDFTNAPVPEILLETVRALEGFKDRVALLVTLPDPRGPLPLPPSSSVPALISVPPV